MVFLYPGAIHIHSIHSDGTGTIEEIARAAKKAGLSWIIVTDHNNMNAKEGLYDGVYVIVGEEISPESGNHYVAIDIKEPISSDMPAEEYIQKVKEQGGFGFIVHPDEQKLRKNSYKSLPWQDWTIKNFGGIEIWNYMSNWVDKYNSRNLFKILNAYLFRNRVLPAPTEKIMNWWDDLNNENYHIIPAIGGVDAHAFNIKRVFITVKIFPYKNIFSTVNNVIHLNEPLSDDFEKSKKLILNSIKSGKNTIMNRTWSKDKNPFFAIYNENKKAYPGDFIKLDNYSKLIVELPSKADIRIIHNGKIILQKNAKTLKFEDLTTGKYRLEAYYKKRPWIFSNPIMVTVNSK